MKDWSSGELCECGITFCAIHRPGFRPRDPRETSVAEWSGNPLYIRSGSELDNCWALDWYSSPDGSNTTVGRLVHNAKYEEPPDPDPAHELGRTMRQLFRTLSHPSQRAVSRLDGLRRFDGVIPIPSPRQRLFDDPLTELPAILAEDIALETGCSFLLAALTTESRRTPIKNLPWEARAGVLRDAYRLTLEVAGARILVVDDVIESGSTLSEAARVLKRAGASEVTGLAAARTGRRRKI